MRKSRYNKHELRNLGLLENTGWLLIKITLTKNISRLRKIGLNLAHASAGGSLASSGNSGSRL